ncbi:HPP family protein [Halopenitus persicus]|uniref:HPP family protein n=1 Tax=Halopenitus persicus TaxID=1048396 RepID=A0A1H3EC79_9EURY|nr:HPP family protein [Halopenitus persicus]QHS17498.1 HPP family protein [haloarchaeon 3A1-DGR]SDX76207.1 HPP family protein [Halopenitus persicus]
MVRRRVYTSLYASLLFTVLGSVAWVTGQPFIFPSLGPSAFVLAFDRHGGRDRARRVVGSHLIGAVAGLAAYLLLAAGVTLVESPDPASLDGLRLAASGTVSIAVTSWAMIATDTNHAPACATTLIVSLGLLSTPRAAATIVVAVAVLVAAHEVALAVAGEVRERLVG